LVNELAATQGTDYDGARKDANGLAGRHSDRTSREPEEVADLVAFLASPLLNLYAITLSNDR